MLGWIGKPLLSVGCLEYVLEKRIFLGVLAQLLKLLLSPFPFLWRVFIFVNRSTEMIRL